MDIYLGVCMHVKMYGYTFIVHIYIYICIEIYVYKSMRIHMINDSYKSNKKMYTGSKACFQKLLGRIKFHCDHYKLRDLHTISYFHCECTIILASILGSCAHAYSHPAPP